MRSNTKHNRPVRTGRRAQQRAINGVCQCGKMLRRYGIYCTRKRHNSRFKYFYDIRLRHRTFGNTGVRTGNVFMGRAAGFHLMKIDAVIRMVAMAMRKKMIGGISIFDQDAVMIVRHHTPVKTQPSRRRENQAQPTNQNCFKKLHHTFTTDPPIRFLKQYKS